MVRSAQAEAEQNMMKRASAEKRQKAQDEDDGAPFLVDLDAPPIHHVQIFVADEKHNKVVLNQGHNRREWRFCHAPGRPGVWMAKEDGGI